MAKAAKKAPPKKRKWTPAGKRKIALNGRYMGYLNGVPKKLRHKVKTLYREKGVSQAIGLAKKLAA
jgi:hypothetical protein